MVSSSDVRVPAKISIDGDDRLSPDYNPAGLRDTIVSIGDRYFNHGREGEDLEQELGDLWDEIFYAARFIFVTGPEAGHLVALILEAREFGHLARSGGQEGAIMPNGQRLWTDLPYLVQELEGMWAMESYKFGITERANLAAFTARLCAAGVCPEELSRCALWLFKETLEMERPLYLRGTFERNMRPCVADSLPACLAWLQFNKFKLVKLSAIDYNSTTHDDEGESAFSTKPGPLAASAGIAQDGFSIKRWLFWRRRFKELYSTGDSEIMKLARACFEEAVQAGRLIGLDIPGEKQYLAQVFQALDRELAARDFVGSVEPSDIEIDMNWAGTD